VIEGEKVKALAQDKNFSRPVAAAAFIGFVVAAGAGVGIGAGDAVEIAGKDQRVVGIGKARAICRAFGHRPPLPFLARPLG